ncbi:hypothetical protein BC832DRAFT_562097, partial [Gaertneriomyces semiglobifer]
MGPELALPVEHCGTLLCVHVLVRVLLMVKRVPFPLTVNPEQSCGTSGCGGELLCT